MGFDLVGFGLIGEEAHAVAHRNVAAISCELRDAAVVHEHGDAVVVDALQLRTGHAGAVAHPRDRSRAVAPAADSGRPCRALPIVTRLGQVKKQTFCGGLYWKLLITV
jgi:hypothetical protein